MRKPRNPRGGHKSIWTVSGDDGPREAAALEGDAYGKMPAGGPSTEQIRAMVEARDYHKQVRAKAEQAHQAEREQLAATKIQSWFRMCRHAKFGGLAFLYRKHFQMQTTAVQVLQRVYRGHLARHSEDFRLRLDFRRLEHNCAITIQSVTRGHLDRKAVRDALQQAEDDRVKRAVIIMQRYARGWRVRKLNNRARTILRAKVGCCAQRHCPAGTDGGVLWVPDPDHRELPCEILPAVARAADGHPARESGEDRAGAGQCAVCAAANFLRFPPSKLSWGLARS